MSKVYSKAEIEGLLNEVDVALAKAAALAKSEPMKKEEEEKPAEMPAEQEAAGQTDAEPMDQPSEEAPAPEASEAPAEEAAEEAQEEAPEMEAAPEQAPEAEAASAEGEEKLEGEDEGQELSDEELQEIYGQMPDEELERHFMIIRSVLQGKMGEEEQAAPEQAPEQAEAAPAANPELDQAAPAEKGEMKSEYGKAEDKDGEMGKSEDFAKAEIQALKKKNEELEKSIQTAVKAMEIVFRPRQKAFTGVNYLNKNEVEPDEAVKKMSKSEKVSKLSEMTKSSKLTSEQRKSINSYILRGDQEEQINQILGGK